MTGPFATPEQTPENKRRVPRAVWVLIGLTAALAVFKVGYLLLVEKRLEQSAALFVGLPAILAVMTALTPKAKSPIGITVKGITLALLMSGVLLGEGLICILMAAPLFYGVGILVAIIVTHVRKKRNTATTAAIALFPFLVMGLEGVNESTSFDRHELVTAERIVEIPAHEFASKLADPPTFEAELPWAFNLGFPLPVGADGRGANIGDRRVVHFAGGEGKPGSVTAQVVERSKHHISLEIVEDTSHIAHWLTWRRSTISWRALDENRTEVRMSITYDRELDPAWYFGPFERAAVESAAGFVVESIGYRAP